MSSLRLTVVEILTFKVTLSEQKQAKLAFWPFLILHKIVFFPSHTSILAEVTHFYAYIHIAKFHTCQSSHFTVMVVQSFKKCKFFNQILGGKISENFSKKGLQRGGSKKLEIILFSQLKNPDKHFFFDFFEKFSQLFL